MSLLTEHSFVQIQRVSGYQHAESLQSSALLLFVNPDALTLWNIRREILLQLRDAYEENNLKQLQCLQEEMSLDSNNEGGSNESQGPALESVSCSAVAGCGNLKALPASWLELISAELAVVSSCLQTNPKSYGAWHHRLWLMEQLCTAASAEQARTAWKEELALCTLFLTKDERNFHCWDYRRAVVKRSCVGPVQELQFSLGLIERNFSNFSAWHYRSKLLPLIHPAAPQSPLPVDEKIFEKELQRVVEAVFTDPGDQSPWFFLRWLLHRQPSLPRFVQVAVHEHNGGVVRVICNFTSPVEDSYVQQHLTLPNSAVPVWHSASGRQYDCVWFTEVENGPNTELHVEASGTVYIVPVGDKSCTSITLARSLSVPPVSTVLSALHKLLRDCNLLHEIDADNKWVLLSLVELLCALGGEDELTRAITIFGRLCAVDPLRTGYYTDRKSSLVLRETVSRHLKRDIASETEAELDCSGLSLTRIDCLHLLACIPRINLSNNRLNSLTGASRLLACSTLILDGNPIEDLNPLRWLKRLRVLYLAGCGLHTCDVLCPLASLPALHSLNLKCNEFNQEQTLLIREAFGHIQSLDM
ncbi:Protein prenyltransferase alpha subunit [Trinorchestia longiramus]|nr:Protein prenyltransferase alpha subunit [Trinorchestia longiramus]